MLINARRQILFVFACSAALLTGATPTPLAAQGTTASLLSAQAAGGQPSKPLPPMLNLEKIKDDLYVMENSDVTPEAVRYWGSNITVLLTNDGVILVDSKFARTRADSDEGDRGSGLIVISIPGSM